jgi:hypothetical protein
MVTGDMFTLIFLGNVHYPNALRTACLTGLLWRVLCSTTVTLLAVVALITTTLSSQNIWAVEHDLLSRSITFGSRDTRLRVYWLIYENSSVRNTSVCLATLVIDIVLHLVLITYGTGISYGPGELSRCSDLLRAGRSGVRIPVGASFSAPVQTGAGTHQPPMQWVPGLSRE